VALLESARQELATSRIEEFKVLLLGAMAGLRRNEIDYRPKSHNSEGDVRVDPEFMELFRGFYERRKGDFVIESDLPAPPFDAPYGVYRCMDHMRALLGWLRSKGVVSRKPLHDLQKEFGSLINQQYGIFAASEQLRHGSVSVTGRHYLENRKASVLGLGHLLPPGRQTIIPMDRNAGVS
jgi:integrase